MKHVCVAAVTLVMVLAISLFHANADDPSVPYMINYQGKLTDANGNPLETKEYTLSFKIFDHYGNLMWGPQIFDGVAGAGHGSKVPVVKGYFNVVLGPYDTQDRGINTAFFSGQKTVQLGTYVEITVDNETIQPRQLIASVPYALQAEIGKYERMCSYPPGCPTTNTIQLDYVNPIGLLNIYVIDGGGTEYHNRLMMVHGCAGRANFTTLDNTYNPKQLITDVSISNSGDHPITITVIPGVEDIRYRYIPLINF